MKTLALDRATTELELGSADPPPQARDPGSFAVVSSYKEVLVPLSDTLTMLLLYEFGPTMVC